MTVTSIQETQDRVIADLEIEQKPKELSSPAVKDLTEGEMDRERRSFRKWKNNNNNNNNNNHNNKKKIGFLHSQVLKIREEDSHLGEDSKEKVMNINGSGSAFNQNMQQLRRVASAVDVVFFSRPILPSSPLSRKTTVKPLP